jgi:hypothetical protein
MAIAAPSATLRLDDITLQQHSAHYPEELRAPYLWLGGFIREECHRDLDALVTRASKLGCEFTRETWSKIVRGRWNLAANGEPLIHPVTSLVDLIDIIDLLKDDAKRREQQGRIPYVKTATGQSIINWIDVKRMVQRVNRYGILVGETGTQKTATLSWYCQEHNHGLCSLIEAPARPSLAEFVTELAIRFGASRQNATTRKIATITESVNDTKTLMIDNAQRLFDPRLGGYQPAFHFLQKLQEDTNCTVILSITPQGEKTLFKGDAAGFFEQFVGRAGGAKGFHRLLAFPTRQDVSAIAKAFGLPLDRQTTRPVKRIVNGKETDVVDNCTTLEYLHHVAQEPGRVRALFEALQTAKVAAERSKEKLTIDHVKAAREEDV